jgi:hypothetical protein
MTSRSPCPQNPALEAALFFWLRTVCVSLMPAGDATRLASMPRLNTETLARAFADDSGFTIEPSGMAWAMLALGFATLPGASDVFWGRCRFERSRMPLTVRLAHTKETIANASPEDVAAFRTLIGVERAALTRGRT